MPSLRVHDAGGVRDYLLGDRAVVGGDRSLDICLPAAGRRLVVIERHGLEYGLIDGDERRTLQPGDELRLFDVRCEFVAEPVFAAAAVVRAVVPVIVRVEAGGAPRDQAVEHDLLIGDATFAGLQIGGGVVRHARLVAVAGAFWLEALDGPVAVDGEPVTRVQLGEGMVVALGATRLQVTRHGLSRLRVYAGDDPHAFVDHRLGVSTRIGSRRINDIVIADNRVTREHCVIEFADDVYTLRDLGSTNGVAVNGARTASRGLVHGDVVVLGQTVCVFLDDPELATPGLTALREAFARAELATPPVPPVFAPLLQVFASWWFGTRRTRGLHQYGARLLAEADDPRVHDYCIVGHAGPAVHAYALHYFVRLGPLLLVLELGAGGASVEPAVTRARVAEAFAAVTALIDAVAALERRGVPPAGLRMSVSTVRASSWQAGEVGGDGDWREVLRAARAWAAADAPFVARPDSGADVPRDRSPQPPVSDAVARVRVYMPGQAGPVDHAIGDELVVGRHTSCEVHVPLGWVSRRHCRIFMTDGHCWIEDLGSAQGTRVEGQTIRGPCLLSHGARVLLGQVEIVYCEARQPAPPRVVTG